MKTKQFEQFIKRFSAETIIKILAPFLTDRRKERIDQVLQNRIHSVQVAVESPTDIHNALAIVRSAEAMGVVKIHLIAPALQRRTGWSTTKGSMIWTDITTYDTTADFLQKNRSLTLAGACVEAEMELDEIPVDQPLCLFFGNESVGLSEEAKKGCTMQYTIPMDGMVESFNLSVAAAISLYEVVRRKREWLTQRGDLPAQKLLEERARSYILSMGTAKAVKIIENQ